MRDKTTFQFIKESLFVLMLFFLFFPLKTQFYNVVYLLSDMLLTRGEISEVFTYNYLGHLLGCLEIKELKESLGSKLKVFNVTTSLLFFLLSLVSWFILKKRALKDQNFKYIDWILFALFSFSLIDSLEFLLNFLNNFSAYISNIQTQFIRIIKNVIILILALYLFFKICNQSIQKQILLILIPISIISFIVWYFYLGPMILPIATK